MTRTKIACLLLVAGSAVGAMAGGAMFSLSGRPAETPEQLLWDSSAGLRERLMSGAIDPHSGKHLVAQEQVVELPPLHAKYAQNWDGTTEDFLLAPTSNDVLVSQSFYPVQPGETGRRPHIFRQYGVDHKLRAERVLSVTGLLSETTDFHADGGSRVIDFAADGKVHVRERVFSPPECCDGTVLLRDQMWRDDASHSLYYSDVFNADRTRTITELDEHERVLKETHWPEYRSTYHATVKAYFPGSYKLRLDSATDYYHDEVEYRRQNGTLEAKVEISSSTLEVHYFDDTGTRERLDQMYFIVSDYKDVISDDAQYKLYEVTEFDDSGNKSRTFSYNGTQVREVEHFNVTVDGIRFAEVDSDYQDGSLREKRYWLNEVKYPPYKVEEHTAAERIMLSERIEPAEMQLQMRLDSGLPRPAPQTGGGH